MAFSRGTGEQSLAALPCEVLLLDSFRAPAFLEQLAFPAFR